MRRNDSIGRLVRRNLALACALATFGCASHASPRASAPSTATTTSAKAQPAPEKKIARTLDKTRADAIDVFARDALARLEVPGAAFAILVGDEVVDESVLGMRTAGGSDSITPRTLFMIGSMTKPITTFMEATLVDQGVVRWDTPLVTLLPDLVLGDADFTRKLLFWHASCACSGMGSQDMESLFEFAGATPEKRIAGMRRLKPAAPIGVRYIYSNAMVALGGYAAAHAAKPNLPLADAYAEIMKSNVLEPIGMSSSTLDFAVAEAAEHATSHATAIDGKVQPIPFALEKNVESIAPSGGLWSNVHDMERYVLTEMRRGLTPEGKRVATEANVDERRKMRIHTEGEDGYGLGMDVGKYDGMRVISHDGGAFGYGASMLIFPEQSVAILILTNVRNGGPYALLPFNRVLERKIVEELFDGEDDRASSMLASFVAGHREQVAKQLEGLDRDPPRAWVTSIAGTYEDPILGKITVTPATHGGVIDVGEWKSAFGRRVEKDGSTKLVLLDAPFAGGKIGVRGPALIVDTEGGEVAVQRSLRERSAPH